MEREDRDLWAHRKRIYILLLSSSTGNVLISPEREWLEGGRTAHLTKKGVHPPICRGAVGICWYFLKRSCSHFSGYQWSGKTENQMPPPHPISSLYIKFKNKYNTGWRSPGAYVFCLMEWNLLKTWIKLIYDEGEGSSNISFWPEFVDIFTLLWDPYALVL